MIRVGADVSKVASGLLALGQERELQERLQERLLHERVQEQLLEPPDEDRVEEAPTKGEVAAPCREASEELAANLDDDELADDDLAAHDDLAEASFEVLVDP